MFWALQRKDLVKTVSSFIDLFQVSCVRVVTSHVIIAMVASPYMGRNLIAFLYLDAYSPHVLPKANIGPSMLVLSFSPVVRGWMAGCVGSGVEEGRSIMEDALGPRDWKTTEKINIVGYRQWRSIWLCIQPQHWFFFHRVEVTSPHLLTDLYSPCSSLGSTFSWSPKCSWTAVRFRIISKD